MKNVLQSIGIATIALAAASCEAEKAATPSNDRVTEYRDLRALGGGLYYLKTQCPTSTVKYGYVLTITNLNMHELNDRFKVGTLVNGNTDVVPTNTDADKPGQANPNGVTPLDFKVNLGQGESALVKIILRPNTLTFMSPNDTGNVMAVTAGDDNGRSMLCGVKVDQARKQATFLVHRGGIDPAAAHAGYNIGLVIDRGNNVVIPLHIDPNIKNDG